MKDALDSRSVKRSSSSLRFTISFCVFLSVLALIFWRQIQSQITFISSAVQSQACPSAHIKSIVFTEHKQFQSMDKEADKHWNDLVTPNGGFLVIPDDEGIEQLYGVSMFHQLHCLTMIRNDFKILINMLDMKTSGGNSTGMALGGHMKRDGHGLHNHDGHFDERHLLHCLDYLRQVFLCYADNTLEKTLPAEDDGHPKVDGMIEHACPGRPDILYTESRKAVTFRGKKGSVRKEA